MNEEETRTTARKALERLERDGWLKEGAANRGATCLGGAWSVALGIGPQWSANDEKFEPLARVIREQYPEFPLTVVYPLYAGVVVKWNDHAETTLEQVRAILEKLAA